jgi:DNA replication protein DnaC
MSLLERAKALGLHGLVGQWERWGSEPWVATLLGVEEQARNQRGMERRISQARLGRFKPLTDFDWNWPTRLDRALIEELCTLEFVTTKRNGIFVGPNGVGKTMVAKNLAYLALLQGHTVRFTTASAMLNDLGSHESARALQAAVRRYCQPSVLVIDEVGYLSYSNRAADLLFEVVTGRYETKSILLTTNKPFAQWDTVFPNATCVVTLVDRLVHHADIVSFEGKSWRLKESQEAERASSARRRARAGK